MMAQSARLLTTACPKPAVPLEDCQREYGSHSLRLSTKIQVYRAVVDPTLCTVQRPGFSIGSRSRYLGSFNSAACAPSLALNGKTTQSKNSSREPACPAQSLSCFKCSWPHHKDGRRTQEPQEGSAIVVVAFSSLARILGECSTIHSLLALFLR